MKILITGASGLLGSKIAEISLYRGYKVYSGFKEHRPELGIPVRLNLLDSARIKDAVREIRPDVIIHAAAMTNVDGCEEHKELAYKINAKGTEVVAKAARSVGSFLVYVSTDYVFDGEKGMYREEDPVNPVNYYGYTKYLGEEYCRNILNDCSIVRTCVIYGSKPARGKVNFAIWLIEKLKRGEQVRIVTDQYVTPTLNTNLADMLLEIAERRLKGVFHLAGVTRVSRFDFAREVAKTFGLDAELILPSRMDEMMWRARRPRDSSLDTSKASKILRRKPYHLKEALRILKEEIEREG